MTVRSVLFHPLVTLAIVGVSAGACAPVDQEDDVSARSAALTVNNSTGSAQTFTASGTIDTSNAFFQSLGTNGRSCLTCHDPNDNWTIVPASLQTRFNNTSGTDPVFRTNDGSNSPLADVSTVTARRAAYSIVVENARSSSLATRSPASGLGSTRCRLRRSFSPC